MIIKDKKLVIKTEPKTIYFDSPKHLDNNLKHELILTQNNQFLAQHTKKNKISQLLSKYKHGNDIHKHGKQ